MIFEVIDEAIPAKVREYLKPDDEAGQNLPGLLHWINTTFPLGLTAERSGFQSMTVDEVIGSLVDKVKKSYELKIQP